MKRALPAWIGVVALAICVLRLLDHYVSPRDVTVWSWLLKNAPGVPGGFDTIFVLTQAPWVLAASASALVMFMLWRGTSGPGSGAFLIAFVLELVRLAPNLITTLGNGGYVQVAPNVIRSAQVFAPLIYIAVLGALAAGLVRSRVVHPWIPWLALLGIPFLVNVLLWTLWVYGWVDLNGLYGGLPLTGQLVDLAGWLRSVVLAVFWLALGADLIVRARILTRAEAPDQRFKADAFTVVAYWEAVGALPGRNTSGGARGGPRAAGEGEG